MIISFEFPDTTIDLKVDLIDNPAIQSWANHFLSQPLEVRSHIISTVTPLPPNFNKLSELYQRCVNNIQELQGWGFEFDLPLPDNVKDVDRHWCNQAHRFFTHTQKYVNNMHFPDLAREDAIARREAISRPLQQLNDNIHEIEDFFLPMTDHPVDFNADEIYCSKFPTYNDPGWWQMEEVWRDYHTADHATVIFGPQILGKALVRSYLDGDNPSDWDTTGHYCNNGALLIQVSNWRNDLYRSQPFQDWLNKWNKQQPYYDFPVGNIADKDALNLVYKKLKSTPKPVRTIYRNE